MTALALPEMHTGENVLAIGVWNRNALSSSDLVLVPQLTINRIPEETMTYIANSSDPLVGNWTTKLFDDTGWQNGAYGVGYETTAAGAAALLATTVPEGTSSVFTRAHVEIADLSSVNRLRLR